MDPRPSPVAGASRREMLALGAGALAASCTAARASAPAEPSVEERGRLDELFADLTDQSGSVEPIRTDERAARRARLGRLLAQHGLDALLCEGGPTMTYLAGVPWGRSERLFGLVVLADGGHFWICPAFEVEKARLRIEADPGGAIVPWDEHEYAWRPLAAALRERRVERLGVEPQTRYFIADGIARELGAEVRCAQSLLLDLRGRKDAHELALLRRASELTQQALVAVAGHARPGMRGDEIARMVHHAQRRLGLRNTWDLSLIGPAAAYPHGENRSLLIEPGELLLVDTGGALHDYQSDTTRTWVVAGAPDAERLRAWHAVRDAQRRAFEALRPGVRCGEIDRVAREHLVRAGFAPGYEHFTHRLGHGIGMEGHEAPYFDGGSDVVLAPGMTLSNEPGIYLLGRFGVRLEDIVVLTEDGADHFGSWQQGPLSPA
jgi:Xaa-Pro dipeptidase